MELHEMGEIADMMLDGTLCANCGAYIESLGEGSPRYCCVACALDSERELDKNNQINP